MLNEIIIIVVGFILLIKGADFLVEGSSNIAKNLHVPEIIIGLTIVSIGTSMPELFVSITSALEDYGDMAVGNVIGSNVCNLLLILGLSAIIRPIQFQRETRFIEIPMCLFFTFVFMFFCNIEAGIGRFDALVLLILFIIFIIYTIVMGIKGKNFEESKKEKELVIESSMLKNVAFVILGIVALKFGGDAVVDNAVIIANKLGISEKIISLTILALGTSLPELVTSVTAGFKGSSDIAIGNIIGSNIFNMLFIIGVTAMIKPIVYNLTYNIDMLVLILGTMLLFLFPFIPPKNEMCRKNGIVYLGLYIGYLAILFMI